MELRFFKCDKCDEILAGKTDKPDIQCGVLVGFTMDENPLACGGLLGEITEDEAMEAAYRRRDGEL
jgi:hypothetical protein